MANINFSGASLYQHTARDYIHHRNMEILMWPVKFLSGKWQILNDRRIVTTEKTSGRCCEANGRMIQIHLANYVSR